MENKIHSQSKILLIDSTLDFSDYEEYIENSEIITLDYVSHQKLTEKKIQHEISDNFVSKNDLKMLENQVYRIVDWYSIPEIAKIILDEEINLGKLSIMKFRTVLVIFIKKFIEINQIYLKHDCNLFIVSHSTNEIISTFTKNTNIIKTTKNHELTSTTLDIPLTLGKKHFTIRLNPKKVSILKYFFNFFSKNIFFNKKIKSDFKSTLLVGFTTLKNKDFLLSSTNYKLNIIKYDLTIPSIWNKKTFEIIRNSNCIIENEFNLSNKKIKNEIELKKSNYQKKLQSILLEDEIFTKHFSINNESFWFAFKSTFTKFYKQYFSESAKEIILTKKLFQKYVFSHVLFFNETEMTEQIVSFFAKKNNVPTFQIQHGVYYDSLEMKNENEFWRLICAKSDFFIAWGDIYKNYYLKNSVNPNKIEVLGASFFDSLFLEANHSKSCDHILLASDPLAFNRLVDLTVFQKELYQNTIEQISKIISKQNKKLIIKTHPQKNQNEKEIVNKIDPKIDVFYSGDIHPLINSADLVIATDMSTVILEAMILQKPVISIRMKDHYGVPEIFNYCTQIPLDSLESWLMNFYRRPELKNELISKGNRFLELYFKNQGNASNEILKYLENS